MEFKPVTVWIWVVLLLLGFVERGSGAPVVYTVSNDNNSGAGSFRDTVQEALGGSGPATIQFERSFIIELATTVTISDIPWVLTINGSAIDLTGTVTLRSVDSKTQAVLGITNASVVLYSIDLAGGKESTSRSGGLVWCEGDPYGTSHTLTIERANLGFGATDFNGGALAVERNCQLILLYSTVAANFASQHGGGVYCSETMRCDIHNSLLLGNGASVGGGFYQEGSDSEGSIEDSTFSDNWASSGHAAFTGGNTTLRGSTFTNNTNSSFPVGAAFTSSYGTFVSSMCIFANPLNLNSPLFSSEGYNIFTDSPTGNRSITDLVNVSDAELGLDDLAYNGGPTYTHKLMQSSVAINKGDPNFNCAGCTDQRGPGYLRVLGGKVDIGAYEFAPPTDSPSVSATISTTATATVTAAASIPVAPSTPTSANPTQSMSSAPRTPTPRSTPKSSEGVVIVGPPTKCSKKEVACPNGKCVRSFSDCDARPPVSGGSNSVDEVDVKIKDPKEKLIINLSVGDKVVGTLLAPPGSFKKGWTVSIRAVGSDKQKKLKEDECGKVKEKKTASRMAPFDVTVYDANGKKVAIKDLPKGLVLKSLVEFPDGFNVKRLQDYCFGFFGDGDKDWSCLKKTKIKKTKLNNVYLFEASTDHLTSFAVFFDFGLVEDECSKSRNTKAYWIAAVVLLGSFFVFAVLLIIAERNIPFVTSFFRGYKQNARSIGDIERDLKSRVGSNTY